MMWSHKRFRVAISLPAPNGTRGPFLTQTWSVKVTVPWNFQVSQIFLTGVYEDLSAHIGIKKQPRPVAEPVRNNDDDDRY